ncbi:AAA family ATPase [Helicobacter burdigaliensis]|uniref:AAA family ATPase n=1 Tax=Helicobacter burdigaliensis TaxID=2315334 RepID=UPI000EF7205C|nr:AAA family ATPase [Helicobacter burdigaliensis]
MITKISMKNVASYKDETTLETNKRINLIYGLNGTGKTQISKFLANPSSEKFKDCKIEGLSNEKILVYNQDFIDENFYDTDRQKGIFTLSEENITIKQEIENLQKESKRLESIQEKNQEKLEEKQKEIAKIENDFKESIWKIKQNHSNDFKDFFEGRMGSKESFLEFINPKIEEVLSLGAINQNINLEELKEQYKILTDATQVKLENINEISNIEFKNIENNSIFNEIIIGNQDSVIANLIKKLGNEDWVKDGFDKYVLEDSQTCPFCQKDTITQEFKSYLENYFDKTYESKIKEVEKLNDDYKNLLSNIPSIETFYRGDILDSKNLEFEKLYSQVKLKLEENIRKIQEKIKEPSKKIELEKTEEVFQNLNNCIKQIQKKIIEFNSKLENPEDEREKLKKQFWEFAIFEKKEIIEKYKKDKKEKEDLKKDLVKKDETIKEEIKNIENTIKEKQKGVINIQESVDKINKYLKDLGILNFYIKVQDDEKQEYVIVREGENKPSFKTLSEGEKTLISFLYFLQLCQGKKEKDEAILDKIIVIDDPISSLSFNYIYEIAQLIKHTFFENALYKQIFIFTHNLYFYHEFFKIINKEDKKNNITSFRIFKNQNNFSCISSLKRDEILNDYQAYWQILKEYKQEKTHKAIIPNTMRNILENFIGFVYAKKLIDIVNEYFANDIQYKAFYRYISRESHSDRENISDVKDIDINMFFEAFENFFNKLKHEEHYEKMMGENND